MAKAKTAEKADKDKKVPERAKLEDIEQIVVKLGKEGNTPSQIGIILRDKYGVPKMKILGKKITQILEENKVTHKDDFKFIEEKISKIESHHNQNKQDKRSEREIVRYVSLKKKLGIIKNR